MPKAPPRNTRRAYDTRTISLCKKACELHRLDGKTKVSIFIEKPGSKPLVFSTEGTEKSGMNWPASDMKDYVTTRDPEVKHLTHFISVHEGTSRGIISSSPPCNPDPDPYFQNLFTNEGQGNDRFFNATPPVEYNRVSRESSTHAALERPQALYTARDISRSPSRMPIPPKVGRLPSSLFHEGIYDT